MVLVKKLREGLLGLTATGMPDTICDRSHSRMKAGIECRSVYLIVAPYWKKYGRFLAKIPVGGYYAEIASG